MLLSFLETPAYGREPRCTKWLGSAVRRLRGREPLELGDMLGPYPVHVFTRSQVAVEIADAGFEIAEHRMLAQPGETTSYACAVIRVK